MTPFKFKCDGLDCSGQIVAQIGSALIVAGMAMDSGSHFLKVGETTRRFDSRQEVEDYATELAQDEDPSKEREMRDQMNGIIRDKDGKVISRRGVPVSKEPLPAKAKAAKGEDTLDPKQEEEFRKAVQEALRRKPDGGHSGMCPQDLRGMA